MGTSFKDTSLYKELVHIGRHTTTLAPKKLTGYSAILSCEAVEARVRLNAGSLARAQAASDAIKDAITSIVTPTTRLIANAALCASSDYEGKTPRERKDLLWESDTITSDDYWKHRRIALREVYVYLRLGELSTKPQADSERKEAKPTTRQTGVASYGTGAWGRIPSANIEPIVRLNQIAERAAAFYFASLSWRFADQFSASTPSARSRRHHQMAQYVYQSYVAFVYGDYRPFIFFDHTSSMKDLVDRHEPLCSPYLTERHPDLSYLITTSAFCDPFGSGHQAALIANALDSGRHATGLRRRIYYEVWWPWFMATPIDSGADPAGLEILVDKAHACYDLLERRLPSMRRAIRDVRTAVRRRLLEIYAVSPRSRFAGAALTTLIDDYFVEQLDSK